MKIRLNLVIGIYLVISSFFSLSWVKQGNVLVAGEEGLPFLNPDRTAQIFSSNWIDINTGTANSIWRPRYPVFIFANILRNIGINNETFTKLLSITLIFLSLISASLLATSLFRSKFTDINSFLAGVLYVINPFVMINIFNRSLYSHLFFLPLLPLSLYFVFQGLLKKKYIYSLLFVIPSLVFSYAFGSPVFALILWIGVSIICLVELFMDKNRFFTIIFSILLVIFWLITNFWWIKPIIVFSESTFERFSTQYNISVINSLSKYYELKYVSRLVDKTFITDNIWGSSYPIKIFETIGWIIPIAVCWALFKSKFKPFSLHMAFLYLIGLILSQGTSGPFGVALQTAMIHIRPLQLLRNPFEKSGLLVALVSSFSLAIIMHHLLQKSNRFIVKISSIILMAIYLFFVNVPYWNGEMYGKGAQSSQVTVPNYYLQTYKLLLAQGDTDAPRILIIPSLFGDGSKLNWNYRGSEPSIYFYPFSSVSRTLFLQKPDENYKNYLNYSYKGENIWKAAQFYGAKYVAINTDIDLKAFDLPNPHEIAKKFETDDNFISLNCCENIILFKLKDSKYLPRVYVPSKIISQNSDQTAFELFVNQNDGRIIPLIVSNEMSDKLKNFDKDTAPTIKVKNVSPDKFLINVNGATAPFPLVFSNTYNKYWKLSLLNSEYQHFVANDFMNGYLINKTGDYQFLLQI